MDDIMSAEAKREYDEWHSFENGTEQDVCSVCSEPVAADTYVHAWPNGGGMHHVVR